MPLLSLRQDQIHVFKLPPTGRLPISVLGYGDKKDEEGPGETVEFWAIDDM